jgi:MoaA/NifB/PqqE/SkfB family radical SAM enzyme
MSEPLLPYTKLHAQNRQELSSALPIALPMSLHVEPTNVCNFRCKSCPHSLGSYEDEVGYLEFMDLAMYKSLMEEISSLGGVRALKLFNYGESFLHKDIAEMIRFAKEIQAADRIEITSNMSRMSRELAESVVLSGLDYLRISIYGMSNDKQRDFTQSRISADKVYENVKLMRDVRESLGRNNPWLYVKMFETASPEELEAFHERYASLADELAVEIVHNMSGVNDIVARLDFDIDVQQVPRQICPQPFYQSSIGANGDVTICCIDWSFSSVVGNLRESSFREIWFGEKLQRVRELLLSGEYRSLRSCKDCTWSWAASDNIDGMGEDKKREILEFYVTNR